MKTTPSPLLFLFGSMIVTTAVAEPGDSIWSYATGDTVFSSPAVGPDGTIYAGSYDTHLYALNPDGTLRWIFAGSTDWLEASPVVHPDGEAVTIGSWDNSIYTLDAATGEMLWSFPTGNLVISTPVFSPDGDILYAASNDGFIYALDADTGAEVWRTFADSAIDASPVYHNGQILVGDTLGYFYAFNAADGSENWRFDVTSVGGNETDRDFGILSTPAVGADGRIYFGCQNYRLYVLSEEGELLWTFEATDAIDSSPVLDDSGAVYFASRDGYLYALDPEGFQIWETLIGDVFFASAAIDAEGNLIIPSYYGNGGTQLVALNSSGEILWSYLIEDFNDSSPTILPDGSIVVGAHDHHIHKVEGNAPLAKTAWPRKHRNLSQNGSTAFTQPTGNLIHTFPWIDRNEGTTSYIEGWGTGWFDHSKYPELQHEDHGILYHSELAPGVFTFYDVKLGWVTFVENDPALLFQHEGQSWLQHVAGTSDESNGRVFFDFAAGDWITFD